MVLTEDSDFPRSQSELEFLGPVPSLSNSTVQCEPDLFMPKT